MRYFIIYNRGRAGGHRQTNTRVHTPEGIIVDTGLRDISIECNLP